ncbi:RDD family protein [Klugiella xanthotipulae]|uniref:Putative RDD family membrane protein YckC n=1 Tax=Klugiella xanthotipulae TaxID=244735 RepID=A0A543HYI7_9MICO|nr:RDD family protein [Klugiella xanthotipulae]TQM63379.1 putative RDD family membrane protein YckC [Klugiella xanthotipulae]
MSTTSGTYSDDLITGEAVALSVRPAGFILRGAGLMIDVLVTLLFTGALLLAASLALAASDADEALARTAVLSCIVIGLVVMPTLVELLTTGRSLGKLATGVRIVRDDGGAIQFRHAFIRALVGFAEIYATGGGGAALTGLLSPTTKRLGDLMAGTYAQHERVPHPTSRPAFLPPELVGWAQVADVAPLPDPLARRIGQFLANAPRMLPEARSTVAAGLAVEVSPYISPAPGGEPLAALQAVMSIRRQRETAALAREAARLARLEPTLTGRPPV